MVIVVKVGPWMPRKRASRYSNITLNAYWIGHSFLWNSVHPILLPLVLLPHAGEAKNTVNGLLTFAGLLIALVAQPISGALSDYTRHAHGRRRPWILAGAVFAAISLLGLALARQLWLIALCYLCLQGSSNAAHGPAQALLPDLVPLGKRGVASGTKSLFDMAGLITAAVVTSRIMGQDSTRPLPAATLILIVLAVSVAITLKGVRETPSLGIAVPPAQTPWSRVRSMLRVKLRGRDAPLRQRAYAKLLVSRFFIFFSTYVVQSFALYYLGDVFDLESPTRMVGNLMTVIGICVAVSVYPAGLLSEKWGRKGLSILACFLVAVGMCIMVLAREVIYLWALAALIGLGMGIFSSVNWAWATDLVPAAEAGKYLGLTNLATAGAAALSRLMGPVVDLINSRFANAGYTALLAVAAAGAFLGLVLTIGIPDTIYSSTTRRSEELLRAALASKDR